MSKPNVRWISVDDEGACVWSRRPHLYRDGCWNLPGDDRDCSEIYVEASEYPALYRVRLEKVE